MFKVIISLLFLFIMLSYVFSSEFITSKTILKDLNLYEKIYKLIIQSQLNPKQERLRKKL